MLARCTAFIATSLDGFIARTDGSIDWLEGANELVPPGEDCGFAKYMGTVDAIVMGRRTFEQVLGFENWPYGEMPVYVMSRSLISIPPSAPLTCSVHDCPPAELASLAWDVGHRRLYVDGGVTIRSFLAAGLLAEITITVVPVLLGEGRPLFGRFAAGDTWLELRETKSFPFGFVQSRYAVKAG